MNDKEKLFDVKRFYPFSNWLEKGGYGLSQIFRRKL